MNTSKSTQYSSNFLVKLKIVGGSVFIGVLLTFFMFLWMNSSSISGEEFGTMGEILHLEHYIESKIPFLEEIHSEKAKEILDNYILIDVSKNNMLLYDDDNITNEQRVDRKKLAELLSLLNRDKQKIKYVVCDILFDQDYNQTEDFVLYSRLDSLEKKGCINSNLMTDLSKKIEKTNVDSFLRANLDSFNSENKLIVPVQYDETSRKIDSCIFPELSFGLGQYKKFFNGSLYRYNFIDYSYRQIPLCMYDKEFHKEEETKLVTHFGIQFLNNHWGRNCGFLLNRIIPILRVRGEDLIPDRNVYSMGDFIAAENLMENIDSPKIVIIGNFQNIDIHSTLSQKMVGPLILLNLQQGLRAGDNFLSWWFILLTLFVYSLIGYFTLTKSSHKLKVSEQKATRKNKNTRKAQVVLSVLSHIFHMFYDFIQEERNHFLLLGYTIVALLFFHHYLFFLSSLMLLLVIEFLIAIFAFLKK